MLKEIGLVWTYFGIETFNEKAGRTVGKGLSFEKKKQALELVKSIWGNDVHIQSGFIVGLPHEDIDSIARTAEYLRTPGCPIDQAWIFPLNIAGPHPITDHLYKSEFDRNYAQYGYYFTDPNKPWLWSKDDDTGINSHDQASKIASEFDFSVPKKLYQGDLYKSTLNHPLLMNTEACLAMSQEEYTAFINTINQTKIFYDTVMEQYFDPLLAKLRHQRAQE